MGMQSINILVVEDNEHDFKKIKRAFKRCDFEVDITRCIRAEEALALIETQQLQVDILITDYMMPGMTGLELSEQLLIQSQAFPIILLTGEGDEYIAVKAMKLGVFDYISKDIDAVFLEMLPDAVNKALQNHSANKALLESQETNQRLSLALEQSRSAISIADLEQRIIYVNPEYVKLYDCLMLDLLGENCLTLLEGFSEQCDLNSLWLEAIDNEYSHVKLKKYNEDGSHYWLSLSMTLIKDNEQSKSSVLIVEERINEQTVIDQLNTVVQEKLLTESQLREAKLKEQEATIKLALTVDELGFLKNALDLHAIVSITDLNGNITYANQKFIDISQYSFDELIGQNHRILKSGYHSESFYKEIWQTIVQGQVWNGEIQNRAKDGSFYWVASTIVPMMSEQGKPKQYISIRTDITDSKNQQLTLELMAHYDILTKLPNRILLSDRFSQAIAHSKRSDMSLAVCFLDLDNFKPINDRYGHKVGDELLVQVSERIKQCIREEDTVSRHGGDEFILLLGSVEDLKQCERLLGRIITTLAKTYSLGKHTVNISASIGFTVYPEDDADFDTLVRHADHAMYQAKLAGRNRFCLFNTREDLKNIQQHFDIDAIKLALENDQFQLHYQPKVNMRSGRIFGFEALIRWYKKDGSIAYPLEFLPVIQGSSVEIELGNWVISKALHELNEWLTRGKKLEVSINISSFHLLSHDFINSLKKALANYPSLDASKVQLEVLESSKLSDEQTINKILKAIQSELGVSIALDDFGTGYSSLAHLKALSVNTIKIDQTFVRDILDDPNDYAIIDGVIGLSDSFQREVIAEGVETVEHGLMLLNMGCELAQGYGIAKPMPAQKVIEWLASYQPVEEWINFNNQSLSLKDNKKALLCLVLKRWLECIENNLLAAPGNLSQWPILNSKETGCGVWIRREKRAHTFDDAWLIQLETLNKQMTLIAKQLIEQYQSGQFDQARQRLGELKLVYNQIETSI